MAERWKVLVTGVTGRVAFPIARELARTHDVYGLARFRNADDDRRVRAVGVTPIAADLASLDVASLPSDITHVFHAGAALHHEARTDWQRTFHINAQVSGQLVAQLPNLRGFVYCSTGSAYEYQGARPLTEDDPPGIHLGVYSFSKIAGEAVVTFAANEHQVPTTIIRIFSTYGPLGGAPSDRLDRIVAGKPVRLHPDAPNHYNPIYEDDYVRLGIRALEVGGVPPVVVNWAGSETVTAEDYCTYLGELVGRPAIIEYDAAAGWPIWPEVTRMHDVLGRTSVPWREGMRRMVAARYPDLLTDA
jgi:UDP-glucuronate 4-epimerase